MKLFKIILLLFISFSILTAQNKEIINKYRPSENDLYKIINQGIRSETVKYIKLFYNEEGTYSYTRKRAFDGRGKVLVFQIYNNKPKINLTLKNLTLSNFDKIIFNLFNVTHIIIDSCTFTNILNGVKFAFKETVNKKDTSSSISIINSQFLDNDLRKNHVENYYQLQFLRNKYAKGMAVLKNVSIKNCEFNMIDSKKSWLVTTAHNTYPSRYSVLFYRNTNKAAFSNITLKNNKFEALTPYYRSEAITFLNIHKGDFRTPKHLYEYNNNVLVSSNVMNTNSKDPAHGIFIQGPYRKVTISKNKINNFGMSINDGKGIHSDGAIHLYGARNSKYSDDIIDAKINKNQIVSTGMAINISGANNILVKNNVIKILPWPGFYKNNKLKNNSDLIGIRCYTGAYLESGKQISNIVLSNNKISCNYISVGIVMQSALNFEISNNKILHPKNYGVLVFGHKNEKNLNLGKSSIVSNLIDYGKQNYKSLASNFYKNYTNNFAAIKIYRMDNGKKYKNEFLIIKNNKIIDRSNTIPKLSVNDLTKSQLKKNIKSDMKIEN